MKLLNPAAVGSIGVRKFGLGGTKANKLLLEDTDAGAYDDNLSDNDRIIKIGGDSEYGGSEQSFLSIR
jgi:hypothetical protein